MNRFLITRRALLAASGAAFASSALSSEATSNNRRFDPTTALRKLEGSQARLGVCFIDTTTNELVGHRLDEHFAFCSTFKLPMVAAVLREADNGRLDLNEVLPFSKSDLLSWAPVTGKHVNNGGLSIALLAQAAQELSDGTAANLLVRRLGGPAAVTAKFREMGDSVTRLDRYEPDLGLVLSGDLRDTTTPRAMAQLVRRISTGSILQPASRQRLVRWMEDTSTGTRRLRAGLPSDWRTGNKTGTGRAEGTTNKCNDVAITFPPHRGAVIVSTYFDSGEYTPQVEARHEAVVAEVGKIAAKWAVS